MCLYIKSAIDEFLKMIKRKKYKWYHAALPWFLIGLAVLAAVNQSGQTLDVELLIYGEVTIVGGGAEGAMVVNATTGDAEGTVIVNARAGVGVAELNGCGQTVTIKTLIREGGAVFVGGNAEGTTVLNGIVDVGE
ncbi:hypothetical protein KSP39_PZI024080 [Platanthera zijinensis]|uniref:Uncharacterized protein n=1 Tax=Platanthera zijinensis TaxID=2320716 RepID=A0AAP0ASF8_9ASPA